MSVTHIFFLSGVGEICYRICSFRAFSKYEICDNRCSGKRTLLQRLNKLFYALFV
jgi:hypothetical protein